MRTENLTLLYPSQTSPSHNLSPDMNMQPKQMYLVREKSIAFFSVPRMIGMTHFV